jgi:hypothetical protein
MSRLVLLCTALVLLPLAARADVAACVTAAEQGQVQRDERALGAARTSFLACVDASCPAAVRKECATWLADVDARLPSIVIVARDARGNDLNDAQVWLDDRALAAGELGRELTLDPGAHHVKARLGEREVELAITAGEREKGRMVTLALPDPPQREKPPVDEPPPPEEKRWLGPVITTSAGVLLAGGAGLIALRARSEADDLRDRCAPTCKGSEVDALETRLRVADVMLVTGALAVAAGVTWYFWPRRKPSAKVGLTPSLGASPRAAVVGLGGRF